MKLLKKIILPFLFVSCVSAGGLTKLPAKNKTVSLTELKAVCIEYKRPELWARIEATPPPNPFKSDGCSMYPDEINGKSIYQACFLHDIAYYVGGTKTNRLIADLQLALDIARLGEPEQAELVFHAVRVGGIPGTGLPWEWGFGFRKP